MKFLVLLVFFWSCSHIKTIENKPESTKKVSQVDLQLKNYKIKPGEVVRIKFPIVDETKDSRLECSNRRIPFFEKDGMYYAFVAETYHTNFKDIECVIEKNQVQVPIAKIAVESKEFPAEKLNVDQRRVVLNPKDLKRVQTEQIFLNKNYASSPDHPYFKESFMIPIGNIVTSIYGSKRIFNNMKQTQYFGTDFRAAIGEPIFAANSGKVVVARDLFFTGLTVTIDHGLGIFSIYGHLSKIEVNEGDYIPRGARLGLSGATGRVTGPHLHWGVKVNGHFVEGESLVRESDF